MIKKIVNKNNKLKKIITNPITITIGMFLFVFTFYFFYISIRTIPVIDKYIKVLYWLMIGSIILSFVLLLVNKKIEKKNFFIFILLIGFALRLIYSLNNGIFTHQHDVGKAYEEGHYGYTFYIFRTLKLPDTNSNQYYQPPLNSILQALFMRFTSLLITCPDSVKEAYQSIFTNTNSIKGNTDLIAYIDKLYSSTRILGCFYTCSTLLVIHYILKEFNLKEKTHCLILSFISVQPVLTMMGGTMNNDNLSYLFFFLALLFAIKWFKHPNYILSVGLAISIGLGMITKLSIGFIALVIGPMMLYKSYKVLKDDKDYTIFIKLLIFAVIVFPLGLSYAIRNYLKFDQGLTYILDFGRDSWLHQNIKNRSFVERFLSLPFSQLIHHEYGIFHDYEEYNIWVDLIKTSIFEEFNYGTQTYPFAAFLFAINLILCLLVIPSVIYLAIILFKRKIEKNKILLVVICILFTILGLASYMSLCIKMPYSCSSNFRYVAYLAFTSITLLALSVEQINKRKLSTVFYSIISIFEVMALIFVLVL